MSSCDEQTLTPMTRAFNFGQFIDGKAQQPIPSDIVPYEAQINAFQEHCYEMCLKINALLGIGLDVCRLTFSSSTRVPYSSRPGPTP
jgi:isopenicillin N synthase-like dioxygenase